jgi:hypothetical protein
LRKFIPAKVYTNKVIDFILQISVENEMYLWVQAESSFVGGGGCRTGDLTVTGVWTPLPGGFPGDFKPTGEFCMGVFTAA